ncbi:MAG: phosphocarrier protein [Cellvibrionaceae bacterium]|jgi:phosphocarrier protein
MITTHLTIINKLGLHARAAAKLATTANRYACDVKLIANSKTVDCKSVMALMLLAASKGTDIQINFDGKDEELASTGVCELINNRFDEDE